MRHDATGVAEAPRRRRDAHGAVPMTDSTERQAEMPVDIDKSLTITPGGSTLVTRTPGVTPKFFHRQGPAWSDQ